MKIYNEDFSKQLTEQEADLTKGKFIVSNLTKNIENNGDTIQEIEEVLVYKLFTEEEIKENLRFERQMQCFEIINRGEMFWNYLWAKYTPEDIAIKKQEIQTWYNNWLDVTNTKIIPLKPIWLD